MKYQSKEIEESGKIITDYDIADFPLNLNKQPVSRKDLEGLPHWHYEVQVSVVTKGAVIFRTKKGDFLLKAGNGLFINSGIMHEVISDEENSEYICCYFDPRILEPEDEKTNWRKNVDPVLAASGMQTVLLQEEIWQKQICSLVLRAEEIFDSGKVNGELPLISVFRSIWELLVANNQDQLAKRIVSQVDRERLDIFLSFIHRNYMENLKLDDIAKAGNVSRGECCRLFKRTIHISPVAYSTRYRIRQGIRLLMFTSLSVAEIARQTGFHTSSYFSDCFKTEIGMSPLKYRNIASGLM